jgi:hypothetical protein
LKLSLGYDGPSRPILISDDQPPRMFSISEFIDGRWQSFEGEDDLCELIMEALNEFQLECANGHKFPAQLPERG